MNRTVSHAALAVLLVLQAGAAIAANYENDEPGARKQTFMAGDVLQVAVPVLGFGLTYFLDARQGARAGSFSASDALDPLRLDGTPRHDFLAASLRMELMTESLKVTVDEQRPNGGSHSFPSGHTSTAFMGAEFIRKEYGWAWGTPAYLAAGFVGWTRVASQNHWTHDVLVGAAVGILSNHDVASFEIPFGTLSVAPSLAAWPDPDAGGAGRLGPALRFALEFGPR